MCIATPQVGRFDINYPKVCGHKSLVMDIAWNPFNDNEIASCSEDCTVKLWDIPDGGIKENLADYKMDMVGHMRKVRGKERERRKGWGERGRVEGGERERGREGRMKGWGERERDRERREIIFLSFPVFPLACTVL